VSDPDRSGLAKHKIKLASLENTYNAEDLKEWDERIHKLVEENE
jgi:NAD-dependent DNA ligase